MNDQLSLFPMPQESRTSDDYWTPKWVFDAMEITFDLDVACPPDGPIHTPCKHFYTQETDGLNNVWEGVVWMNPPYSNASPWVEKFMTHRNGICLVPFARSAWANKLWNDCDGIVMMPSTFKFEQGSIFIQTMLAAYGDKCTTAIGRIGKVR